MGIVGEMSALNVGGGVVFRVGVVLLSNGSGYSVTTAPKVPGESAGLAVLWREGRSLMST